MYSDTHYSCSRRPVTFPHYFTFPRHHLQVLLFFLIPGAIFDLDEVAAKTGFLFAVSDFNKRENQSFKLSAAVGAIRIKDSYDLATTSEW